MSIRFERNEKWVELQEFWNDIVKEYLDSQLNQNIDSFESVSKANFGNCEMMKYKDVYFMVFAENSWIELSFDISDREKMEDVIEVITKWERFSKTEKTFYVEVHKEQSCSIIFENGYASCGDYRRRFGNNELKITSFKIS